MSYIKQVWQNFKSGGTPLSADRLNHIEEGLEAAHQELGGLSGAFAPYGHSWFVPASITPRDYVGFQHVTFSTSYPLLNLRSNGGGALNSWAEYATSPLAAGTYTLDVWGRTGATQGIRTFTLDGDEVATQDWHDADGGLAMMTTTGIVIPEPGVHVLRLTVTGQNPSATGYVCHLSGLALTRTGDLP